MSESKSPADSNAAERRVYHLTPDILERLRAYQADNKIPSEVEAVRRLLNVALEMRDTVESILRQLQTRFAEEGDLRVLGSEILARHSLVTKLEFDDDSVWFRMRAGRQGKIDSRGNLYIGDADDGDGDVRRWLPNPPPSPPSTGYGGGRSRAASGGGGGGWDAPKKDLDDDIPF